MGNITISQAWVWLVGVMTAILTIDKCAGILQKWLKPKRNKALEGRMDEMDQFQAVMCRTMLALLNHALSGNGVEHLRDARDEMSRFLTDRQVKGDKG